jgi:putative sigma-54 modulation protein
MMARGGQSLGSGTSLAGIGLLRKLHSADCPRGLHARGAGVNRSRVARRNCLAHKEFHHVQVAISCKHGQLTANQQEYLTRKAEKLLTYFERVTAIHVTVTKEKGRVRVEILVDAEHKHNFVANDVGDDVVPTFDLTLHKMEQQIKKYKEKIQDHRRNLPMNELGQSE